MYDIPRRFEDKINKKLRRDRRNRKQAKNRKKEQALENERYDGFK